MDEKMEISPMEAGYIMSLLVPKMRENGGDIVIYSLLKKIQHAFQENIYSYLIADYILVYENNYCKGWTKE